MTEKLEQIVKNYQAITKKLEDGEIYSDPAAVAKLMKEQKELAPVVETYSAYRAARARMEEARALADSEDDAELKELGREEYDAAAAESEELADRLRLLLLPRDPNDDRSVIIEIRAGAGGDEAALFAAVLYRMYSMYADSRRWHTEIINSNDTELGGYKEISFSIDGDGAYSRFKFESGVHRVQRVPETESQGRIHTSTVTVAVLPEADDVEIEINTQDLQIDTYRSGGAGGQHVNKTESAIRITHIPTGVVVECQDERSQYKNKDKAMRVLKTKLLEAARSEHDALIAADRKSQVGTGDRSERIRTYNYPQGRVTDHRIGFTTYRFEDVLNGNFDEIIDALITADRAARLSESSDGV